MRKEERQYLGSRLFYELVPPSMQGKAPRNMVGPSVWDAIGAYVRERAGFGCEICGRKHKQLHAHERYAVGGDALILKRIICVCPSCHLAIHPGFAQAKRMGKTAFAKYAKVNEIPVWLAKEECIKAMEQWRKRADVRNLDWSMLANDPYRGFLSDELIQKAEQSYIKVEIILPLAYIP